MKIWTLDDIFRRWPSLWFRIAFETALPTIAAIIWGLRAYFRTGGIFDALTAAGLAFPLVLFVQGQILRMAKNVRDEQDANEFRESFATIKEGVDEIKRLTQITPSPQPVPEIQTTVRAASEDLMAEAKIAVARGLYTSGALAAAVEFERQLRALAQSIELNTQRPLTRVADELAGRTADKDLWLQLRSLVRMRNSLVHLRPREDKIDRAEAEQIIQAFQSGIEWLKSLLGRKQP
jgi:hypothetical protein